MSRKSTNQHRRENYKSRHRRMHVEHLESRHMLAGIKADVVFLVDESQSDVGSATKNWLRAAVTGDLDANGVSDVQSLSEKLATSGIDDVRYGLVGFGELNRLAHSQLLEPGNTQSLLANPNQLTTAQLNAVFNGLSEVGGQEDGWDAMEHAIAEYNVRDGAVPIYVLLQNDEGRAGNDNSFGNNRTLVHDGVLAALRSKNAILNTLVVGERTGSTGAFDWKPLFDMTPYEASAGAFTNRRVLGVEADATDNTADGYHDYYLIQTNTSGQAVAPDATKPATESDAIQVSFDGSNTGATGMVGTGKSVLIGQNISGGIGGVHPALALAA